MYNTMYLTVCAMGAACRFLILLALPAGVALLLWGVPLAFPMLKLAGTLTCAYLPLMLLEEYMDERVSRRRWEGFNDE